MSVSLRTWRSPPHRGRRHYAQHLRSGLLDCDVKVAARLMSKVATFEHRIESKYAKVALSAIPGVPIN